MKITVPDFAMDHFWEEPPADSEEFWGFRWKPKAQVGDTIHFMHHGIEIARAIIDRIERPGTAACDRTGKFSRTWNVFWTQESFQDMRGTHA